MSAHYCGHCRHWGGPDTKDEDGCVVGKCWSKNSPLYRHEMRGDTTRGDRDLSGYDFDCWEADDDT